jgi:hypothetical protein
MTKTYNLIFNDGTEIITDVKAETCEEAEKYFVEHLYRMFQEMDPNAEWSQKDAIRENIKKDYYIIKK